MSPLGPYGTWDSPLEVGEVARHRVSRSALASDGSALWWLEGRPEQAGRVVLVRATGPGQQAVVSPEAQSIRSRVHEYGGGAWCLLAQAPNSFAYVEEHSQRIVTLNAPRAEPRPLTPVAPEGERWCHGGLSTGPPGWVFAIRERHLKDRVLRSVHALCVDVPGEEVQLCAGRDFFGAVALSPGGDRVAWVSWDHPNMPWDETQLWVAHLVAGCRLQAVERIGGEELASSSLDQPVWLDDDHLAFLADAKGWWQPWVWRSGHRVHQLSELPSDFQGPAWSLGQHSLVALSPNELGCVWRRDGLDRVGVLGLDGRLEEFEQPCVAVSSLCAHRGGLAWLGQSTTAPVGVFAANPQPGSQAMVVSGAVPVLGPQDISVAEPLVVPGTGGRLVHAHYYPPKRQGWRAEDGARPPLIVQCHGGPTGSADAGFDPVIQLFTTRGYAVVAVNYAGSTGYGRDYRQALEGSWGQVDVDDCAAVASWLASSGRVEGTKMAIRGASAGGLTALGALVRWRVFAAAVCWYAVSDLMGLVATTHDFESRYTDRLVGPLPASLEQYQQRSPLYRVGDIEGAVLLLQGEEDPVVPASQTRSMAAALTQHGVRCEVRYFPGESHGFRRAETLMDCYQSELAFYQDVLVGRADEMS